MTFKDLQDDMVDELERVLKDIVTRDAAGREAVGIKGYAHMLPPVESDEDDPNQRFPFFIVRTDTVATDGDGDCWHAMLHVIIGIHGREGNGHDHLLIAMQRVMDRFAADPVLKGRFRADQDMRAAVQDEDTYPFYLGIVQLGFSVPKIGRR